MKKILSLLIILVALVAPMASKAEIRWGALAGADFTTLKFKQDLITIRSTTGFQAGVQGEMMFPGIGFGIDLGLMYTMRGANVNLGEKLVWSSDGYGDPRIFLHYVDIPVNLRFKWTRMGGIEDYWAPFVFGGPVLSILAGHSQCKAMQFAAGELGLQVGGGFEIMRRWQIQACYTWGMTYALKTRKLDDFSANNRTLSIRAVYFF